MNNNNNEKNIDNEKNINNNNNNEPDFSLKDITDKFKEFNRYATKKTIGQGVLDIALLAANITKLIAVLDREDKDGVFYFLVISISLVFILQLVVGFFMFLLGRMSLKTEQDQNRANFINNIALGLLSLICVIDIVISGVDAWDKRRNEK